MGCFAPELFVNQPPEKYSESKNTIVLSTYAICKEADLVIVLGMKAAGANAEAEAIMRAVRAMVNFIVDDCLWFVIAVFFEWLLMEFQRRADCMDGGRNIGDEATANKQALLPGATSGGGNLMDLSTSCPHNHFFDGMTARHFKREVCAVRIGTLGMTVF
jgi:hypothetical protein